MAKEPLTEQEIHDLLTRARVEPTAEFKTELRSWLRIKLRQQLRKANTNGHRPTWHHTSWHLYKGHDNMKKITPLVAVLSLVFLVVVAGGFGIMLASSSQQDEEGSFAAAGEETATPELIEGTSTAASPTEEATATPAVEVLTATPSALPFFTPTAYSGVPPIASDQSIGSQVDLLIRTLHPEFYTYNEIMVDDDGVQVREARYYGNDSFVILTERMAPNQPLPEGEEINLNYYPVILVEELEGKALLTMDTLQYSISRPFLGGGGGGGGGGGPNITEEPRLFPEEIEYTDGLMVTWNINDEQISLLTNLPQDDLLDIARLTIRIQTGSLEVGIPGFTPEPGMFVFEYEGPGYGFSTLVEDLIFKPLKPHYLPAALLTGEDEDEIFGVDAIRGDNGSSVELQVYKVKSEEFLIIRQRVSDPVDTMDPTQADEIVEVNGQPALMVYDPACSLTVPDWGGKTKQLVCTDSWSLSWYAEGLRIEMIGNNLPKSEGILIANGLKLD